MKRKTLLLLLTMYTLIIIIILLLLLLIPDGKSSIPVKGKVVFANEQTLAGIELNHTVYISAPTPTPEITLAPSPTPTPTETPIVKKEKPQPPSLDIPLSNKLQQYIFKECEYDKDLYLMVISIIKTETDFDIDAVGIDGHDKGLMQVRDCNLEYLNEQFGNVDLMEPYDNVKCGIHIIRKYYDKYEYVNLIAMAYNLGETGARRKWREGIYSTEYSMKVTEYYRSYKK